MERELGISYPTVRSRLDQVIRALGFDVRETEEDSKSDERRKEILSRLNRGELKPDEAVRLLKQVK